MKHRLKCMFIPVILALGLLVGGCAEGPQVQETQPDLIEKRMILTDSSSSSNSAVFAPESPEITNESAITSREDKPLGESAASVASSETRASESIAPASSSSASQSSEEASPASSVQSSVPKESSSRQSNTETQTVTIIMKGEQVRAVWISYLDLSPMLTGKSRTEFTASIADAFDKVKEFGLNTVFVHVRPFGDALYQSDYFPWSYLTTGTEGVDPGYDPLTIMVAEAKRRGLRIEAWLNPYRVRMSGSDKAVSNGNQANVWLNSGHDGAIKYGGVISYNPASPEARELIINGAREIVRNYNVDGIHIDDYFYPHTDAAFDKDSYDAYKRNGGKLVLADWRRENVLTLIKGMYVAVKEERSDAVFGISPQSSLQNNYNSQYLDMSEIVSKPGYCDYVCPQVYFGFENGTQPFAETMDTWDTLIKTSSVKLYTGLAVYKAGLPDSYAGDGKAEWQQNNDLLQRMVSHSRSLSNYGGFCLYRYDSIFNPSSEVKSHIEKEKLNLQKILS